MPLYPRNLGSYEGIAFTFGFRVPDAFAQYLGRLYEHSHRDGKRTLALFERLTGLMLDGPDARYQQTPPEVFPIASMGVDGVHYGYVVHAPELPSSDYPIGQVSPMDDGGVTLEGRNTQETLRNWVANAIREEQGDEQREELRNISRALGVDTDSPPEPASPGEGRYSPIRPSVPAGWRYIPSSDGVGVLAPEGMLDPEPPMAIEKRKPEEFIRGADRALANRFPATALYYLREGFWHNWTDANAARRFSYRMATAYMELNRGTLAQIAAQRVEKHFAQRR